MAGKHEVYFVTSNNSKALTAKRFFARYGIELEHVNIDMPEPRSFDLKEIAHAKAKIAYSRIGKPCIVQDSGFYITAANGFPRTFVHFGLDTIGIKGMLKLVEGNPDRSCSFRACLTYCQGPEDYTDFLAIDWGTLAESPKGQSRSYHWSELFKIFIPKGSKKTLAEMSKNEYEEWSSRENRESEWMQFVNWYNRPHQH